MINHTGLCDRSEGSFCKLEHSYYCKSCGELFPSTLETQEWGTPSEFWPYCSAVCAS